MEGARQHLTDDDRAGLAAHEPSTAERPAESDPFEALRERGIATEVWEARGYVPYYGKRHPLHDPQAVKEALGAYTLSDNQAAFYADVTARARNAPPPGREDDPKRDREEHEGRGCGLLMHKHPAPGCESVLPQLRPEYAVELDKRGEWHRHDWAYGDDEEGLAAHIHDDHEGDAPPPRKWHAHPSMAKYLIAPTVKVRVPHDHATDPTFDGPKGRERLEGHLRSRRWGHKGKPREGAHNHTRERPGQHVAERLDIHPWALERLPTASRVYFCIEGTPKADAILTRIREDNAHASVFDVPSVTLWKAPELPHFASEYLMHVERDPAHLWQWTPVLALGRKLVVIVADADWHHKPQVVRQALRCREELRKLAVAACVAAPPARRGQPECACRGARAIDRGACAECGGYLKGVDDFLAAGGDLDDLLVLEREVSPTSPSLALYTREDGTIRASVWTLAELIGVRGTAEDVLQALRRLVESGAVASDRPLATSLNEWTEEEDWNGPADSWPALTIRNDLRYTERHVRLADYSLSAPLTRQQILYDEFWQARGDDLPNVHHLAVAIGATAARTGYSARTIQADRHTMALRAFVESFSATIRALAPDDQAAADALGVSRKTIQRTPPATAAGVLDLGAEKLRRYLGWDRNEAGGG